MLRLETLLQFERDGHCTTRSLVPQLPLDAIDAAFSSQSLAVHRQKLRVILGEDEAAAAEAHASSDAARLKALRRKLASLPEGAVPFLQGFNLWRGSAEVAALAGSAELAGTAARLLGVERVRLYQDSLFVKRPSDGETHWHSDLAMAPLDTNSFVTCWLPLQPVPAESDGGSALVFASGSHRDVALHFWHGDPKRDADCSGRGYEEAVPMKRLQVGDASWHHGWTLHCASPNALQKPRRALAFSYFADGATRLKASARRAVHSEDAESYAAWLGDVKPGAAARHALLPLVWDGQPVAVGAPSRAKSKKPRARKR